jgi:hypothetical protein
MSESKVIPTIGRRIWFFPGDKESLAMSILNDSPCDAGIVFVHPDGTVNLSVTDHEGCLHAKFHVPIVADGEGLPFHASRAEWMPYQVKADAKHKAETTVAPANKVTPEQIQALKDRVTYYTVPRLGKTTSTFVHAYLDDRFFLASGHSACVDPDNYVWETGVGIARQNAEQAVNQKLWELEGYRLYSDLL